MKSIEVTHAERLLLILDTFSQLDDIRWAETLNYNLINYCHYDLTPDEQLLTHWLCYITDRQMPFERIWDIGGYVISHLVKAFIREKDCNVLDLLTSYIRREDNQLKLECPRETAKNARLERYEITGEKVKFASRYMPDDLVKIYRTLEILSRHSGKSLASFIIDSFRDSFRAENDYSLAIQHIATALDQLTYAVGTVSEFSQALDKMAAEAAAFALPSKIKRDLFGRKRLWCALRDYLKSPEFNPVFVSCLKESGLENPERWDRTNPKLKQALRVIELPGDVWNNAKVFRDGLFRPYLRNERPSWDMPRTIRGVYKLLRKDHDLRFYPEQLDVTFDFVPRMCRRNMCDVCLFGNGIDQVCHQKAGSLCPVALISCGYRHTCTPETCRLRENGAKGYCGCSMVKEPIL